MADVRNIEGLRWLAEVQQSHAAQWALGHIAALEMQIENIDEAVNCSQAPDLLD